MQPEHKRPKPLPKGEGGLVPHEQ